MHAHPPKYGFRIYTTKVKKYEGQKKEKREKPMNALKKCVIKLV